MAIQTHCPNCRTSYSVPDAVSGKKVQCKKCGKPFVAVPLAPSESPPAAPAPAAPDDPLKKVLEQLASPTIPATAPVVSVPVQPAPLLPATPRVAASAPRPLPAAPLPPAPPRKRSPMFMVGLIGGGLAVVLGLTAVIGGTAYLMLHSDKKGGSTGGSASSDPSGDPVTQALADLRNSDNEARVSGASTLAATPVDNARQAEVATALQPLLNDDDARVRLAAAKALAAWATRDSVPALATALGDGRPGSDEIRHVVLETLGRLQDNRAAAAVAERLAYDRDRATASQALREMGPTADRAVVPFCFDPKPEVQAEARQLVRNFGTADSVILDQALVELESNNPNRRKAAAEWLVEADPSQSPRRAEVAKALEVFLNDPDPFGASPGLKALARWATKENVPSLSQALQKATRSTPQSRQQVMEILARIKDPRAAEAIASRLPDFFDRQHAAAALRSMGSAAQDAVAPYRFHKDKQVREEAANLLKAYGTKDDVLLAAAARAFKAADDGGPVSVLQGDGRQAAIQWLATVDAETLRRSEYAGEIVTEVAGWLLKSDDPFAKQSRLDAILVLRNIKDPKGARAVADRLFRYPAHRDAKEALAASQALAAMGPGAEDPVIECLASNDNEVRATACQILQVIGTKKSVAILTKASKPGRPEANVAKAALKEIQAREKAKP